MHISFSEIMLVLIVALIVIKPERLPDTVRALGQWLGWMRQTSQKIKLEMEKPLNMFAKQEVQKQDYTKMKQTEKV